MLNIITFDGSNRDEYAKYRDRGHIWLDDTERIERAFFKLFNKMLWKEDEGWGGAITQFNSQIDISLMKEIDNAERCDLLVVKTPIGTAPLTCLSTGCKFGLLVNYYSQIESKIVVSGRSAGMNVWQWIGKNLDITLYMDKREVIDWFLHSEYIMIDGIALTSSCLKVRNMDEELKIVTSEKLRNLYKQVIWNYKKEGEITIPVNMQCDYLGLENLLRDVDEMTVFDYVERYPVLKKYRFDIRIEKIYVEDLFKYPAVWIFRKKGDSYQFTLDNVGGYPNFLDILCEVEDIYQADTELEEIFMVVFQTPTSVIVDSHYPECISYSLVYTLRDKVMSIIGVLETIEKLNDIAVKTEIEVTDAYKCPRKRVKEDW